jgi:hypothetical protein
MEAEQMVLPVFSHQAGQSGHQFKTHMTGGEEVPSNTSRAQGQTILRLSADGTELSYKLIVANIRNVTQAHIHMAPAGANGGGGVAVSERAAGAADPRQDAGRV